MQSLRANTLRVAVLLVISSPAAADCLAVFNNLRATLAGQQVEGWMDNHGRPVPAANATAMSYALCIQACGSGSHFRTWNVFSQRFSTWLLPFLALVSQLPFGANNRLDNLMSILLNVGSPTLGAYSVLLTLLNGRWVTRRFSKISYPNAKSAGRILNMLQQVPLKVTTEDGLLASLIVLHENNEWWADLLVWLDINYMYTWSFANVASIGWVVIAFSLTVVDIFTALTSNSSPPLNSDGLAVAFAWLWLLPIVVSWLQFGPRCDRVSLHRALRHANGHAWLATDTRDPVPVNMKLNRRAIELAPWDGNFGADEHRTPPVYNYARLFRWNAAVEAVYSGFSEASRRAAQRTPVEGTVWTVGDPEIEIHLENRHGSLEHVSNYIRGEVAFKNHWISSSVVCRMFASAIFALLLTWGTVSAAMLLEWLTPTIGLSCRSGSYLMYASVSTIVWVLLVISSVLSSVPSPSPHLRQTAVCLRHSGKSLAVLNAAWILLICIFQFAGVYDTCWCDGSVLYLGPRSYVVWILTPADIAEFWYPVVGGTVLASGTVFAFLTFIHILLDPQLTS
ncbi:hypothetical protein MVEN_02213000 [Mycena venus]|uniref:Uncharacterized protein n=1 Tax=Mycena venus TaxID=2733690 RepID=A0A8H6X7K1_9AGAR|nr:hypothetical protein MVEN_02213000 [Mycena venus]